ncbi:MAG TPA: family 16 glycosylhydrolase [Thermoleophilaceae bacterium]
MSLLRKGALRALPVLAVAMSLLAPAAVAAPPALTDPTQVWHQTFGDEFDGVALDPTRWTTCYWWIAGDGGCTNSGNGELEWYMPGNVIESDGTLKLQARKETAVAPDGKTYAYTSGMISTGRDSNLLSTPPRFEFKYGYMEMRAKLPAGMGLWPAFWTLPSSHGWPPEIDVMEGRGDRPNDVNVGVFNKTSTGATVHGSVWVTGLADYTADFHTFAVDWQPSYLDYYIDGVLRIRVTDTTRIPTQPMYVLANLAVGGNWPGSPDANTPFPSNLEIDWIHVFEREGDTTAPSVEITAPRTGSIVKRSTTVALAASATDNVAVSKVEFYNGSTRLGTDTTAPYTGSWKAPTKRGLQTITAKAYDPAGNVATTSSTVSVS